MKKHLRIKNGGQFFRMAGLVRQNWIGLAFAVICVLALVASPAEAAPSTQRTVPTATPPPPATPTPEEDNNGGGDVLDLFDPTATPEPPDFNDDENNNQGGGSFGGSDNNDSDNNNSSSDNFGNDNNIDPFAETDDEFSDAAAPDEPAFNDGTVLDGLELPSGVGEDTLDAVVDTSFLNMFADPDPNSGIIDTLFRNTPVQILAKDASGDWVYICCGEERGNQGWVPASDINFGFDTSSSAIDLPVFGEVAADEGLNSALPVGADGPLDIEIALAELELAMILDSSNVVPGQTVEVEYAITNVGDIGATEISLRNELPGILTFVDADFTGGNLTTTTNASNNDAPVFRIDWPELAAGETLNATVIIQVRDDADYGVVVDNLAGVGAANAEIETAGVTLGTPPLLPPDFRFFQ